MAKDLSNASYMDGVPVKISEKYKPPPRINLPITYAQRLALNEQIQKGLIEYTPILETTVLEKMKEWRNARCMMFQEVKERVKMSKNRHKEMDEKRSDGEMEEACLTPSRSVLIPTQAKILTPLKTDSFNKSAVIQTIPFNISDFEADTSSPFDNMELKSINDMEELAQVLKPISSVTSNNPPNTYQNCSYNMNSDVNFAYNIPYVQPVYFRDTQVNGYSGGGLDVYSSKVNCVPDIIKSLENQLVSSTSQSDRQETVGKKDDSGWFKSLPKSMQDLSLSISSMGFPLDRVAKVCKIVGSDEKKVIFLI